LFQFELSFNKDCSVQSFIRSCLLPTLTITTNKRVRNKHVSRRIRW